MIAADLMAKFGVLRARIEAKTVLPAVVAVTSACDADGTSLVSLGLARSLDEAGYRVLLINTDPRAEAVFGGKSVSRLALQRDVDLSAHATRHVDGIPDSLSLTSDDVARSCSVEAIRTAIDRARASYDCTVVCAPQPMQSSVAFAFARFADSAVVAVRQGRASTQADLDLAELLENGAATMLGVLTVAAAQVREFDAHGPKMLGELAPYKRRQEGGARARSVA